MLEDDGTDVLGLIVFGDGLDGFLVPFELIGMHVFVYVVFIAEEGAAVEDDKSIIDAAVFIQNVDDIIAHAVDVVGTVHVKTILDLVGHQVSAEHLLCFDLISSQHLFERAFLVVIAETERPRDVETVDELRKLFETRQIVGIESGTQGHHFLKIVRAVSRHHDHIGLRAFDDVSRRGHRPFVAQAKIKLHVIIRAGGIDEVHIRELLYFESAVAPHGDRMGYVFALRRRILTRESTDGEYENEQRDEGDLNKFFHCCFLFLSNGREWGRRDPRRDGERPTRISECSYMLRTYLTELSRIV